MKLPLVVPKIAKTCVPKVLPAAMDQSIRSMICKQEKNMSQTEMATLTSYFTDTFPIQQLSAGNRQLVMKWLAKRNAYEVLAKLETDYLYSASKLLKDERESPQATLQEIRLYLKALARLRRYDELDHLMSSLIKKYALNKTRDMLLLIGTVCHECCSPALGKNSSDVIEFYKRWPAWMKLLTGHADFSQKKENRYNIGTIISTINVVKKLDEQIYKVFDYLKDTHGPTLCSEFGSTLMSILNRDKDTKMIQLIWEYKHAHQLPLSSYDLTRIMQTKIMERDYKGAVNVYINNPSAHLDVKQFDYLLIALSKTYDWSALQDQFNALFGIGKLPSIEQYGIVMAALATQGELESVDQLYQQLLRRGLIPNFMVIRALLEVHFRSGDYRGCFEHFELFDKYGISPSMGTYTVMFNVYKKINDIDGALRFLRKITNTNKSMIREKHFLVLMQLCSKFTNHLIAEELFNIMQTNYDITPSASSVAVLIKVYLDSEQDRKALSLFKKFRKETENPFKYIEVFNAILPYFIKTHQIQECESLFKEMSIHCERLDAEYMRNFIKYFIDAKKDVDAAKDLLFSLIKSNRSLVDETLFERVMEKYDELENDQMIIELYRLTNEIDMPINSKILLYLMKASYRVHVIQEENLNKFLELFEQTLTSVSNGTLNITTNSIHPSIINWFVRSLSKSHLTDRAIELLNKYTNILFDDKSPDKLRFDTQFTTMRSKLVYYGECEQWDNFEDIFEDFLNRIEYLENRPSRTVKNLRMKSIFNGILTYRLRNLVARKKFEEIPKLIEYLHKHQFTITNQFLNEAVSYMFLDSRTIEEALRISNDKLIHGFNLLNKKKHLQANEYRYNRHDTSWLLAQVKKNPGKFSTDMHMTWATFTDATCAIDRYLNKFSLEEKDNILRNFIEKYPYFMKSYLMKERELVKDWKQIESNHANYFKKLRDTKRTVFVSEF